MLLTLANWKNERLIPTGLYKASRLAKRTNDSGSSPTDLEPALYKGQSKRIWSELHKIIDASDVIITVVDARDPIRTRCKAIEEFIAAENPQKHIVLLSNKCDLVPTAVAAAWIKRLSQE